MTLEQRRANKFADLWSEEEGFDCRDEIAQDPRTGRWFFGDAEYINGGYDDGEESYRWTVFFGCVDGRQVVEYEFTGGTSKHPEQKGVRHELAVKIIETVARVCVEMGDPMETRQ